MMYELLKSMVSEMKKTNTASKVVNIAPYGTFTVSLR
jgi:hypothetical protein